MSDVRCGTTSGYSTHQRAGEKPCDACARAKREYDARWRSAPERTRKNRLAAKAQARAAARLREIHPEQWRALYSEELVKARQEADR